MYANRKLCTVAVMLCIEITVEESNYPREKELRLGKCKTESIHFSACFEWETFYNSFQMLILIEHWIYLPFIFFSTLNGCVCVCACEIFIIIFLIAHFKHMANVKWKWNEHTNIANNEKHTNQANRIQWKSEQFSTVQRCTNTAQRHNNRRDEKKQ